EPLHLENITLRTTASIGAAIFPTDGTSSGTLQSHADLAMYRAKERGRNSYQMFSTDLADQLARRRELERYLQAPLDQNAFELHYHAIYSVSRELVSLEALIRFKHPDLKAISPGEFMQVAEQTGQIAEIGYWVLREACRQAKEWEKDGFVSIPIAVNVSTLQL